MLFQNQYRTNTCGELRQNNIGSPVQVCGWVQTIRDHGGVLFADIRDQYGVVQAVFHDKALLKGVTKESVVSVGGTVVQRDPETINVKIPTGYVEVAAKSLTILSRAVSGLPFEIDQSKETREDLRLSYRFLDLRNPKVHENIVLRSQIIAHLRPKDDPIGVFGNSNADFVCIFTGRCQRLSGSQPETSGAVLCFAASATDF